MFGADERGGDHRPARVLQLVRYLHDPDGVDRDGEDVPDPLGWHLDRAVLDFLAATGAELDVDEYAFG
ncbi:hypothetical protein [Phytomonospora endophytica]|uniref:Uncharacterized protein n=1 Tax=Phytomonospora endophytica TaxID=714109 RepID=A0A841FM95_9ACTN|nr:hypothetical protein [Phytomonospora endophytica]MBB6034918.1 hypothetical protein [Phytomonospora endophytica]